MKWKTSILFLFFLPKLAFAETYVSPMPSLGLTMDPVKSTEGFSLFIIRQMCDRLVAYDDKLNVIPRIAKSWKISEDGKNYIFELRENLRFSDGRTLTASDVIWSLSRMLGKNSPKYYELAYIKGAKEYHEGKLNIVKGIHSLGKYVVEIELTRPYPPILSILSAPGSEIFPLVKDRKLENNFFERPVCYGPYKIIQKNDQIVRLEANDKYYDGENNRVNFIEFRQMDRDTAIKCFLNNECHDLRWYPIQPNELTGNYKIDRFPVAHVNLIAFNTIRSPFSNINVRRAIAMAIDRERLLQLCYPDKNIARGYIPPGLGGYDTEIDDTLYDPDKAKELLSTSGIPMSILKKKYVLLRMSNYACQEKFKQYIEESLSKIGMNINVRYVSPNHFFNKYYNARDFDMLNFTMTSDYTEAIYILNYFRSAYPTNFTGLKDVQIDSLLEQSVGTNNRYERYELYRRIQKRLVDLVPVINMCYDVWTTYYQNNIVGYKNTPLAIYNSSIRDVKIVNKNLNIE